MFSIGAKVLVYYVVVCKGKRIDQNSLFALPMEARSKFSVDFTAIVFLTVGELAALFRMDLRHCDL